jgi:Spy/CpxP family protein refolding chaperone
MKSSAKVVLLGLVLALPFAGVILRADEWGTKMDTGKHMEKMTKQLNLTKEQQDQVKKLMDEKNMKIQEAHQNYDDQVKMLLNDEQKKKWDEMEKTEKEEKQHMKMKHEKKEMGK